MNTMNRIMETLGAIVAVLVLAIIIGWMNRHSEKPVSCDGYTVLSADEIILCTGDTLRVSAQPWKRTPEEDSILLKYMSR